MLPKQPFALLSHPPHSSRCQRSRRPSSGWRRTCCRRAAAAWPRQEVRAVAALRMASARVGETCQAAGCRDWSEATTRMLTRQWCGGGPVVAGAVVVVPLEMARSMRVIGSLPVGVISFLES